MSNKNKTIFQSLGSALLYGFDKNVEDQQKMVRSYTINNETPIFKTKDKDEYEKTKEQLKQEKYLANQWIGAGINLGQSTALVSNNLKLMYRDCDIMDGYPEIGAALDLYSEESNIINTKGQILNITSNSERVKKILDDLFVNRLDIHINLPMWTRSMCKYGNAFVMLNIDNKNGIIGARQLPVYEIERVENGLYNPYLAVPTNHNTNKDTEFVWVGQNIGMPFKSWQIAHFRLLTDSLFLPYGISVLHKARRHFRILSMMEDMMLIYRLERSIERRVFKIFVGNIDDADIPAYVQKIANTFKRTTIVDPETGQLDLRKNMMPVWKNTPIPLLDGRTITIEELAKEYNEGKENFVYSIQDNSNKIVPGKVSWCGKNYTADRMIKVWLDDDTYMCMAEEHPIVMRDGTKKRADEVNVGDSVMPFYIKCEPKSNKLFDRYEKIYNPNSGKFEPTHRLISSEIKKEVDTYNTVHHKDFNKYNNNPSNLIWMDYHDHHKIHDEISKSIWLDPEKRKIICEKLSKKAIDRFKSGFPKETSHKISKTLIKKYSNGELDWVKEKNKHSFDEYNKTEEYRNNLIKLGKELGYRKEFKEYNNSDKHKEHDDIRIKASKESWIGEGRNNRIRKMNIHFDEYVWNQLRINIINGNIINRKTIINFINDNLIDHIISINENKRLLNNRFVERGIIENRIKEKGFNTITEFIQNQKKNHKIKKIEYINGDDVYCMTVVGLNDEEDRHNFAAKSINIDNSISESGIFLGNSVDQDIFYPVKDINAPNPIDTLPAASNIDKIEDLKYIQNKVLTALRIPKEFLNFEEAAGDGKNLAIKDIRFTRTINRIQQSLIMELTKIAVIHLYLNGFTDELTNFKISMNNPSTQSEILKLEELSKKVSLVTAAVVDPGNGIPIMSMTRAQREILGWSDDEITQNMLEIRLEKALSAELLKTEQIIKRTHLFDEIDNIYGEEDAEYTTSVMDDEGGPSGGGGVGIGGGFEGDFDMGGTEGGQEEPSIEDNLAPGGNETPVPGQENTSEKQEDNTKLESIQKHIKNLLTEDKDLKNKLVQKVIKERKDKYLNAYFNYLKESNKKDKPDNIVPIINQAFIKNEETNKMIDLLEQKLKE